MIKECVSPPRLLELCPACARQHLHVKSGGKGKRHAVVCQSTEFLPGRRRKLGNTSALPPAAGYLTSAVGAGAASLLPPALIPPALILPSHIPLVPCEGGAAAVGKMSCNRYPVHVKAVGFMQCRKQKVLEFFIFSLFLALFFSLNIIYRLGG